MPQLLEPCGEPFLREPCLEVRQGYLLVHPLTSQSLPVHSREQIKRVSFYEMLSFLKKKNYFFIWLFQVLVADLRCSLWEVNSLAAACGIYFPDPRWILGALHGERRVLATGSAGKSLEMHQVERRRWAHGEGCSGPSLGGRVCTLGRRLQGCAVGVSDLLLQRPEGGISLVCSWGFLHLNMYTSHLEN